MSLRRNISAENMNNVRSKKYGISPNVIEEKYLC